MKIPAMTITLLASAALLGGCMPHHERLVDEPLPMPPSSASADAGAGADMGAAAQPQPQPRRGLRFAVVAHAPFHKGTVRAAVDWSHKRPDAMVDVEANAGPLPAAVELHAETHERGPGGVALDVKTPAGRAEAAYGADVSGSAASE